MKLKKLLCAIGWHSWELINYIPIEKHFELPQDELEHTKGYRQAFSLFTPVYTYECRDCDKQITKKSKITFS